MIKDVGVDWKKTKTLRDDHESAFNGTFDDATTVKTMYGTLILKDGTEIPMGQDFSDMEGDVRDIIRIALEYGDKLDDY